MRDTSLNNKGPIRYSLLRGLEISLPEVSAGQLGLHELIALLKSANPETLSKVAYF